MENYELFVASLKEELLDHEPEKYDEFLKLTTDYKDKRIDETSFNSQMVELMREHHKLVLSVRDFFPKVYDVFFDDAAETFMNNVKERFETVDKHKYKQVAQELKRYLREEKPKEEVIKEILDILTYHEDLTKEFSKFFL